MFPKHTQLQKSTLAIHVETPMLSLLMMPSVVTLSMETLRVFDRGGVIDGVGTMLGSIPNITTVPMTPTVVDRTKPGFDLSMRYHNTGLTRARVNETCKVDCQGSLRC